MRRRTSWLLVAAAVAALVTGGAVRVLTTRAVPAAAGTRTPAAAGVFSTAGTRSPSGHAHRRSSAHPTTQAPDTPVAMSSVLPHAVAAIGGGRLGLAVYDRRTHTMVADHHGSEPFAAESVVKLLIALDTLHRGGPPDRVAEMLSRSDDTTATALWNAGGRTAVVTRTARRLGLRHTTAPRLDYMWGQTSLTADDVVDIYRYILTRAPDATRDTILTALRNATQYAVDGFDQYFGIPYAAGGRPWAVKQGWACCRPGRDLHTTGLLGTGDRYIVVGLTEHSPDTSWAADKGDLTLLVHRLLPALAP